MCEGQQFQHHATLVAALQLVHALLSAQASRSKSSAAAASGSSMTDASVVIDFSQFLLPHLCRLMMGAQQESSFGTSAVATDSGTSAHSDHDHGGAEWSHVSGIPAQGSGRSSSLRVLTPSAAQAGSSGAAGAEEDVYILAAQCLADAVRRAGGSAVAFGNSHTATDLSVAEPNQPRDRVTVRRSSLKGNTGSVRGLAAAADTPVVAEMDQTGRLTDAAFMDVAFQYLRSDQAVNTTNTTLALVQAVRDVATKRAASSAESSASPARAVPLTQDQCAVLQQLKAELMRSPTLAADDTNAQELRAVLDQMLDARTVG